MPKCLMRPKSVFLCFFAVVTLPHLLCEMNISRPSGIGKGSFIISFHENLSLCIKYTYTHKSCLLKDQKMAFFGGENFSWLPSHIPVYFDFIILCTKLDPERVRSGWRVFIFSGLHFNLEELKCRCTWGRRATYL